MPPEPSSSLASSSMDNKSPVSRATRPAFGDQPIDGLIQPLACAFETADGGQGQLFEQLRERHQDHFEQVEHLGESRTDIVRFGIDVRAEQRFRDNRERQPHHLLQHVEGLAGLPLIANHGRALHHHGAIAGQPVAMERGLDQAALAAMMLAFAGEKSVAQQHAGALQHAALLELVLVGDQNVADRVGMSYVINVLAAQRNIDHIAILAGHVFEKPGRVFAELGQNADQETAFRPGRLHHYRSGFTRQRL